MAKQNSTIISLFSGALGLDLGLERAGFKTRVAVECNRHAAATIRLNRPDIKLFEKKIEDVPTSELLKAAKLKAGEAAIVAAGPACQAFSTAGQRGSIADPRGNMFREFLRVVEEAKPRFFVMENVKGLLSAAVKHRPLNQRGPGFAKLKPEEELGSAFALILEELKKTGYYIVFDLLDAADYGVPQSRQRVVFIGSRDGEDIKLISPTHSKNGANGKLPWVNLRKAFAGLKEKAPNYAPLSPAYKKVLKKVPVGGNWRDLKPALQKKALGKAFVSWGGRSGFFRRLSWKKPSPALTTHPSYKATMLCHPTKLRPLSVREYARIQQFQDDWKFAGTIGEQYKQIGNAVPVGLGEVIGRTIKKAMKSKKSNKLRGVIVCHNQRLIEQLSNRPHTMLNPPRMRKIKNAQKARKWLGQNGRRREIVNRYILSGNGSTNQRQHALDTKPS